MEQVFFRLHVRLIRFVSPVLTPRIRILLEKFVLLNSVLSLCLLIWLHMSYVNYPQSSQSNCLYQELVSKNMTGNVADYDVIKVHISNDWLRQLNHDTYHSDRSSVCYATNKYDVSPTDTDSRGITEASPTSEKLPILFDSFISSMGMHIHDSQHSTPRYESSGRGGGSARLFSVAERLLSSPGPAASSHMDISAEQSGEYSGAEIDIIGDVDTTTNPKMDSEVPEAMPGSEVTPSALPTEMANILKNFFVSQRVYLFSLEKGYLMLHPDERDRHDIRRLDLTIARDSKCFGPASSAWLVHSFIGYDTVVMNWAISTFGGRGYLYNIYSKELFNLNFASDLLEKTGAAPVPDIVKPKEGSDVEVEVEDSVLWWIYRRLEQFTQRTRGGKLVQFSFVGARHFIAFKVGVIFSTLFLFFTTTTLVSFTLRETQERMLKFTFLLQHHVSHRIPYAPLVFTHVVESLVFVPIMVGILFFLFEFFSDQLLAFLVLSVVWLSEIFSVICLRTYPTISFFPRAFFFYFSLFHIYFFSFPFGFSYLALFTAVLFIQHSMIFCWNTYEIPALESGVITALTLRVGMGPGVRDLRTGDGTPITPLGPLELRRFSAQGIQSAQSDGQDAPSHVQSPATPGFLTVDVTPEHSLGPHSISRRPPSGPDTDPDHELHLRESYSRNVALSRRIQQEQLSAMLGIHVPLRGSSMSLSSHSNSLPPSPHRSRASSSATYTMIGTPLPSPLSRDQHDVRTLTPTEILSTPSNTPTILSYPISFMSSLSAGINWFVSSNDYDSDADFREGRILFEDETETDSIEDVTSRLLVRTDDAESNGYDADTQDTGPRGLRLAVDGVAATPLRRKSVSRCGSNDSRVHRSGGLAALSPTSKGLKSRSTSRDFSDPFGVTDSKGSSTPGNKSIILSSPSAEKQGRGVLVGDIDTSGVMDIDDMSPQQRRSRSKRTRESRCNSSTQSIPCKYQHNEMVMYNSDFDMTDELLGLGTGTTRVTGSPRARSYLSSPESRSSKHSAGEAGDQSGPDCFDEKSSGTVSTAENTESPGYLRGTSYLHSPDAAASLSGTPGETYSSSRVKTPIYSAVSSSSGSGNNRGVSAGDAEECSADADVKSRPTALTAPDTKERDALYALMFPTLGHLDRHTVIETGIEDGFGQGMRSADYRSASEEKDPNSKSSKPARSRSLISPRVKGSGSSIGPLQPWGSNGSGTSSGGDMHLPSNPAPNPDTRPPQILPDTATFCSPEVIISPARRIPSVNDFGYRRNDFNMFGNDFNEED